MKKTTLLLLLLVICSIGIFAFKTLQKSNKRETIQKLRTGNSYETEWSRVDSLQNKGLSKSALELVLAIYAKAKAEKNSTNFIRALIEKMKYESYLEEDSYVKAIGNLEEEASKSQFPINSIIHSIAAETYWRYYQNNRYRFMDRTETINFINSDIRTWDLRKIVEKVSQNYLISLRSSDLLKRTSLSDFDPILVKVAGSKAFRPTLYDFLAHRALDYFMNEEPELTKAAYSFELADSSYFSSYTEFKRIKLFAIDSNAIKFQALKLLQNLISFHSSDKNPTALIDVDLKRLRFIYEHSIIPEKDSLFLISLIKVENEFEKFEGSTFASYLIASYYWNQSNLNSELNQTKFRKLALEKCEIVISKFPQSEGAINCGYLKSLILEKSLSVTLEDAVIPEKPSLCLVQYRNVRKVFIKLVKLPQTNEFDLDRGISKEVELKLLKKESESSWSSLLPDDKDYLEHKVQLRIPPLKSGHYILFLGTDSSFSAIKNGLAHANFWVTNISYLTQRTTDGSFEGYLLSRESGLPLDACTIHLWSEKYDYVARVNQFEKGPELTIDKSGYFKIPSVENNRSFYIEIKGKKDDRICSDYGYYQYRDNSQIPNRYAQTFFFTDRKIYRPGQTIFFKGIMVERDGENSKIVVNQKSDVVFYDVNGQKISELKLTTNDFGSFSGSFIAPQGILNGQMSISNGSGSSFFSIEEYKRPKFEVEFDAIKGAFHLGDSVSVRGRGISYSGAFIDGAKVSYKVIRKAVIPNWWAIRDGYRESAPSMEISNGFVKTNEKGEFEIHFKAIPDLTISKSNSIYFNYRIQADITDISGETHSSEKNVNIGYSTLLLSTNLKTNLNKLNVPEVSIKSSSLNGDYVATSGVFRIFKLKQPTRLYRDRKWEKPDKFTMSKEEFEKEFPTDLYDDEDNKFNWEKDKMVSEIYFNTDTSISKSAGKLILNNIKKWEQGEYFWEAISLDKYNQEIRIQDYFTLYSPLEKKIPSIGVNYFSMLVDRGEPGENGVAVIGTNEKGVKCLYEVEKNGEIVKREWISISEEQKIVEIPIEEMDRGNFAVHFTYVKNNRVYKNDALILVPFTNKELAITFETFRSKLYPGQQEEWKIKISNPTGENIATEMLAAVYDASLDVFASNNWLMNLYQSQYIHRSWEESNSFKINSATANGINWNHNSEESVHDYDALDWFGFDGYAFYGSGRGAVLADEILASPRSMQSSGEMNDKSIIGKAFTASPMRPEGSTNSKLSLNEKSINEQSTLNESVRKSNSLTFSTRKNFNETAFFYPQMEPDEKGEISIKFTIPEALTKWKMLGLAHTKNLQIGNIEREFTTQKELMVSLNAPRFFREGDKINLAAKLNNLAEYNLEGVVNLQLFNALNMHDITDEILKSSNASITFNVKKQQSEKASWSLQIPPGIEAITYRITAKTNDFSDGEEMTIPVLSNRMLVTESLPLPFQGNRDKSFSFEKLLTQNKHSGTLSNYKVSLEFTTNPAWLAIQSLPYLMEYPYECAEQTFARFYANSIATHIANSDPKIKAVFDSWNSAVSSTNKNALLSNLEKNQNLKSLFIQETPWVVQAKTESERKQRLGFLFDLNRMNNEMGTTILKLKAMQSSNGGWPWFEGMPEDVCITQYIIAGMGHLDHLGVKKIRDDESNFHMIQIAVSYMDERLKEQYERILKNDAIHLKSNHLNYEIIQYLYARSYFKDIKLGKGSEVAFEYYKKQASVYWLSQSKYMQGMIALALNRSSNRKVSLDIIKSLKENAISNEELGMYWKDNIGGYFWHQAPIETQALLIEAFDEISNDLESVEKMKLWLLKNKQTSDWKTTKATSEACYALLLRGNNWLSTDKGVEITIGSKRINTKDAVDLKREDGTGYFQTSWSGFEVAANMGNVTLHKTNTDTSSTGIMWGAVYWQYFENLDKITESNSSLHLTKKIFIERNSERGLVIQEVDSMNKLEVGEKVKIRIELKVDRDMEYVQMKDMRSSGFEPMNINSSYKFQDGLGYYESSGDAATNFFFSFLPRGTYLFEYPLRVAQSGNFSNGVCSIQCMYAPEFASHSEGIRLNVNK